jgi:hypothetical protein
MDFAQALKDLSDTHFSAGEKIILVQDNLNTDKPASFYEVSPAAEARRLVERFERYYTPKHGNWLNLAESELCLVGSSPRITSRRRRPHGSYERALAICCRC